MLREQKTYLDIAEKTGGFYSYNKPVSTLFKKLGKERYEDMI